MTAALACTFCSTPLDLRATRCPGCGGPAGLAASILAALSANGQLPIAALARHLRVGADQVVAALDEIEAVGIRLHRADNAVEIDEAAQPEMIVTDLRAILDGPWPANPVVGGMPARRVGEGPALLAKRMRQRIDTPRRDYAGLAAVAARLAEMGVRPAGGVL